MYPTPSVIFIVQPVEIAAPLKHRSTLSRKASNSDHVGARVLQRNLAWAGITVMTSHLSYAVMMSRASTYHSAPILSLR